MNWVGNLIQKEITSNDSILDLGCGIMQATLDHVSTYPKTKLRCKKITGLDIYEPYLKFLNERYPEIETIKWDLRKTPLPFKDKSHDIIILTDILEHLETLPQVTSVLEEAERIARKKIFVLTPNIFWRNEEAIDYHNLGRNKFELHNLLITNSFLKEMGFKTEKHFKKHIFGVKRLNLKILHVWDVAGVAACLSKYQRRLGHDVRILLNKDYDTYKYRDIYNYDCLLHNPKIFKNRFIKIFFGFLRYIIKYLMMKTFIENFDPDIIHFHVMENLPLLFPFRKKIMEFHGTRFRYVWADGSRNDLRKTPRWIFKMYSLFKIDYFVSTPDLLKDAPQGRLIENPIDLDHFDASKYEIPKNRRALYSLNHYENQAKAVVTSLFYDLNLNILDRTKEFFCHKDFPYFLSQFEYYIDRHNVESLSKTALEALALGLKVIRWDDKIIEEFPKDHDPYLVAKKTIEIYRNIIEGK